MSAGDGARGVVAEAITGAVAGIADVQKSAAGEQLPMFDVPTRHTGARAAELQRAIEHKRDRGRPPGATNKATKAMREYLLGRGINPLQAMMQWALHTPTSLAAEIGCTRLEAFDRLKDLWAELAPFFAAKMVPVDDEGRPLPFFQFNFAGTAMAARPGASAEPPWITALRQLEENQGLKDVTPQVSHGATSHEGEKPA